MATASNVAIEVIPTGAPLGAEIRGVDSSEDLDTATLEAIMRAWDEHLVLLFRAQQLSEPLLLAFARHFGELDPPGPNPYGRTFLPKYPELNVISNVRDADGRPIGNLGDGEAVWHADMTYLDTPPKGAIVYGVEIPSGQGDTYFANMITAYATLADDLKRRIAGKRVIHDAAHNSAGMLRKGYKEIDDVRQAPGVRHPHWCAPIRQPAGRLYSWAAARTPTSSVFRYRRVRRCWMRCGNTPAVCDLPGDISGASATF